MDQIGSVSLNSRMDLCRYILNRAKTDKSDSYYYVDSANSYHAKSWKALIKAHPEYKGKYLVPTYSS